MKEIQPSKLKKMEKPELGLFSVPMFGLNYEGEGVEVRKIIFCGERSEDSKKWISFSIALFVLQIWDFLFTTSPVCLLRQIEGMVNKEDVVTAITWRAWFFTADSTNQNDIQYMTPQNKLSLLIFTVVAWFFNKFSPAVSYTIYVNMLMYGFSSLITNWFLSVDTSFTQIYLRQYNTFLSTAISVL